MYYLHNAHGDVTQLLNEKGEVIKDYRYDPFGKEQTTEFAAFGGNQAKELWRQEVEKIDNPFRYAGEYQDEETGNYYLRARYYDPNILRFTQEDSYGVLKGAGWSQHLYGYGANNPLRFIDPTGHAITEWDKAHLNDKDRKRLDELGKKWDTGDAKDKKSAHEEAESIRNTYRTSNEVGSRDGNTIDKRTGKVVTGKNEDTTLKGKTIVVDPGHGGKYPGAITTYNGTTYYEKNINLSIALSLRDNLVSRGAKVIMTRISDKTVENPNRYKLANSSNADIFVSIHNNSSRFGLKSGTTVVYPANHDIEASKRLAMNINGSVVEWTGLEFNDVYQDDELAVLNGTTMPAVTTETGYMSSDDIEYIVNNTSLTGFSISQGIVDYFKGF